MLPLKWQQFGQYIPLEGLRYMGFAKRWFLIMDTIIKVVAKIQMQGENPTAVKIEHANR